MEEKEAAIETPESAETKEAEGKTTENPVSQTNSDQKDENIKPADSVPSPRPSETTPVNTVPQLNSDQREDEATEYVVTPKTQEDNPPKSPADQAEDDATKQHAVENVETPKIQEDNPPTKNAETTKIHKDTSPKPTAESAPLKERFKASMVLGGVGDALGYKNGLYEFCNNGEFINQDVVHTSGGVLNIKVNHWMVSDDTVMHIATAEALVSEWIAKKDLYLILAEKYINCMKDMSGRAPGDTCMASTEILEQKLPNKKYDIPFNARGGGCGAAMRAVPIGLLFNRPNQVNDLIAISIESGRMTHNHPTGYLGALATALFVSYAVQQKPLVEWGRGLLECLPLAKEYVEEIGRDVAQNIAHWDYFGDRWREYLKERQIDNGQSSPSFPEQYGPSERDKFYCSVSFSGWGGASGHDAPMIAYDALLGSGSSWEELCKRGMFHGGDSDSTGIIAAACWGAMNGYLNVPQGHYECLEYRDRLEALAENLYHRMQSL